MDFASCTEIIYEKYYPRINLEEEFRQLNMEIIEDRELPFPTFQELLDYFSKETFYIHLPHRVESSEKFIQLAIDISKRYELDTKITRYKDCIRVDYAFDSAGEMCGVNQLFGMADQFSFFNNINGRDITVSMVYYTHVVFRNGRIIAP